LTDEFVFPRFPSPFFLSLFEISWFGISIPTAFYVEATVFFFCALKRVKRDFFFAWFSFKIDVAP